MLDEGKEVSISFDYTDVIVLRYHDGFGGLWECHYITISQMSLPFFRLCRDTSSSSGWVSVSWSSSSNSSGGERRRAKEVIAQVLSDKDQILSPRLDSRRC